MPRLAGISRFGNPFFLVLIGLTAAGCVRGKVKNDPALAAEARAVEFLKREVPAWSRDNGCFSCHNNGDAARALYAATRKGHRISTHVLADTTDWVAQPGHWEHNKGDPGFSDQRLANIQFAAALLAAFEAGHLIDRKPLHQAAGMVAVDQAKNGSWPIEPGNVVGSPATYGTTLATWMALRTLKRADAPGTSEAIRRAEGWLRQAPMENVLSAAVIMLASARDSGESVRVKQDQCLKLIRRAQTGDGGWGPYPDSPPEPFDTAVVLLALAAIRDASGVSELIQRGRSFLIGQQRPDGSWPATTRPPGGLSYAQRLSTTGWAALALLETR
jgi:hypothetical protein